jgi:hypothetical protein
MQAYFSEAVKSSFRDQSLSSRFGQLADHIRLLILFTLCSPRVATFPIPGDTFSQGNALLAHSGVDSFLLWGGSTYFCIR